MRVETNTDGHRVMIPCGFCHKEFQYGPHRYAGRKIVAWNVLICETCDDMNHDGLDPHRHMKLVQRLKGEGVHLDWLDGGFLAIPARGY